MGRPEGEVALVTGTGDPEMELVEFNVTVWVRTEVLVEPEAVTGEPSVDEVESVPLLGPLLKLTVTVVARVVVIVPVLVGKGAEVEFEGPMGDPEVTEPEGTGGPQLPVP